jgi:hypothetical protein
MTAPAEAPRNLPLGIEVGKCLMWGQSGFIVCYLPSDETISLLERRVGSRMFATGWTKIIL